MTSRIKAWAVMEGRKLIATFRLYGDAEIARRWLSNKRTVHRVTITLDKPKRKGK